MRCFALFTISDDNTYAVRFILPQRICFYSSFNTKVTSSVLSCNPRLSVFDCIELRKMWNFNTQSIFIQSDFPEGFWSSGINVLVMLLSDGREIVIGNRQRDSFGLTVLHTGLWAVGKAFSLGLSLPLFYDKSWRRKGRLCHFPHNVSWRSPHNL